MKFKNSILITILLLISTQCSAAVIELPPSAAVTEEPPAYSELVTTQPSVVATQPPLVATEPQAIANQHVIIQRTITVCPQCGCSANSFIRVSACLAAPIILPIAFGAGAIHGCACGGLEVCGQVSEKAQEEGDLGSACCTCCCCPCICIAGTIAGTGEKAIKYVARVIDFIKNGN